MVDMSRARRFRANRVLILLAVAIFTILLVYLLLKYFSRMMLMYDDPVRSPPALQIRSQTIQLSAPIKNIVVPDDEVGFILPPGLDQTVPTYDFTFRRVADSRGFPNASDWPKTADIVFLGDSLIMGEGVGVENGFVSLTDQALKEVSVVNLGNPGAGLERQYRIFRRFGADLVPSLIVSCLYLASDLKNDMHFSAWLTDPVGMTYNDFRLSYARRHARQSRNSLLSRIQGRPIYYWAQSVVEPRLGGDRKILHSLAMQDGSTLLFNRDAVKFAKRGFFADEPEFIRFSKSLTRLQSLADRRNAALVFILIPSKEEIFAEDVTVKPNSAAGIIKEELIRRQITFLDLYPILKEFAEKRTPYFPRDIHLNEDGNKMVAEVVSKWIESMRSR